MNKEQFSLSIQQADNISLRNGAANRILQLLQKQSHSNNENSAKRWIWELCQNAKDVCNSTGKVKICIDYNKEQKKVFFKHNGKAFTMNNIVSLINQSSSKDRNDGSERKSGKFGTGFITTHLLSEIVDISGVLESDSGYSKFNISLDRRGKEKNEIIVAMENAIAELENCIPIDALDFNENEYNTIFKYQLDEYGVQVAKDGLENLRVSAPFVLALLPEIEEISIVHTGEKFRYNNDMKCTVPNMAVSEILLESQECQKNIYVLRITENNISVLIALEKSNKQLKILPYSKQQSKLFCDFPLIGTEDFPFPVLINSQDFNPTEPRDGVFLTCSNKSRVDDEIAQNRTIIETACNLYKELLVYVSRKKCEGIYNITHINSYEKKEWHDEEWLKNIVSECKDMILHTPIICTENNSMTELLNDWDYKQIHIISERSKDTREKIWHLLNYIMPDSLPRRADIHNWYTSLWSDCNKYTIRELSELVQSYNDIETLDSELRGIEWNNWLLDYYALIDKYEDHQKYLAVNNISILPNQNGAFRSIGKLYFDAGVLEEYKLIMNELGIDSKSSLLDSKINNRVWFQCEVYSNHNILKDIEKELENSNKEIQDKVLFKLVFMYEKSYEHLDMQKKICDYAKCILDLKCDMIDVEIISQELLQCAMKRTITCIANKISECKSIDGLVKYMKVPRETAISFLADFIEFINKNGYEVLITRVKKPILPNQNGDFVTKENIFLDNEIDDVLKDIAKLSGYDIRSELLMKEVFLELPKNRQKSNDDLATCITNFVEKNRTAKNDNIREGFNKLLIWINDNSDEASTIFPSLYKNKHYLYDDEEIVKNIKQAETLTNIMVKYNIASSDKLEEILRNSGVISNTEEFQEKENITKEVLLQYGIDSEEALDRAFSNTEFSSVFKRETKHDLETYEYVKNILNRSRENIFKYLETQQEYDVSNIQKIADTIFVVKKKRKGNLCVGKTFRWRRSTHSL